MFLLSLDLFFYIFYFVFILLLFVIFRLANFKINELKPLNILIVIFIVFSYIGILPLYLGSSPYFVNVGITDKYIVFTMLLFSMYSITCFFIVGSYVNSKIRYNNIFNRKITILNIKHKIFLIFSLVLVLLVIIDYISKIDTLAILIILAQDEGSVGTARSSMGNDFSGGYHWYSVIMHDILFIITASFFINYLISKKRTDGFFFLLALLLNSFSLIMATEKAPIIWLLLSLILIYLIIKKNSKFKTRELLYSFFSISLILTIMVSSFMGVDNIGDAYASIFRRAFAGSVAPAYFYLDFIPNHQSFLFGRSFPNPSGILPFEHYNLTVEIMNWRFPILSEKGIVGSSPTVYWAEAYANFGVLGVLVIPAIMATYVSIIFKLSSKLQYNSVTLAFLIWLIMHFKDLSQSGFSGYFFDMKLVVVLIFVITINYLPLFIINKKRIKNV